MKLTALLSLLLLASVCSAAPECTDGMVLIGTEYYKVFDHLIVPDIGFQWWSAKDRCILDGLVMAEPIENPKAVADYIDDVYGGAAYLGARSLANDSSTFAWNSGTDFLVPDDLWFPGWEPGSDYCEHNGPCCLMTYDGEHPYQAYPCDSGGLAICQCPEE